jgi:DNA-binding transcriptional LysR family regulator
MIRQGVYMELRHLRYFVAVAENLHFGHAAEWLGMAQPPLSQQIKSLEQEVGVPLLLRTKRRVALTAAGAVFLGEARKILAHVDQAVRESRRAARGEIGELVVGFVSSAVYGKVPSIFAAMRERYPDVSLILQDMTTEDQIDALKGHRLDVGLVRPPLIASEPLVMQVIWREPMMVALPETHPLAGQREIVIEALAQETFLQVPRHAGPGFYDQFIRVCAEAGFSPNVAEVARTAPTIVNLIAGGMGVSIVPASLQNLRRKGVVYRPLKPPVPTTDLAVMWRPDDESAALRSFLEIVRQVAEIDDVV